MNAYEALELVRDMNETPARAYAADTGRQYFTPDDLPPGE